MSGDSVQNVSASLSFLALEKRKFGKTSELMEGFYFALSITGLNRPSTRKDDDYVLYILGFMNI
jgi:hypothetical protein